MCMVRGVGESMNKDVIRKVLMRVQFKSLESFLRFTRIALLYEVYEDVQDITVSKSGDVRATIVIIMKPITRVDEKAMMWFADEYVSYYTVDLKRYGLFVNPRKIERVENEDAVIVKIPIMIRKPLLDR